MTKGLVAFVAGIILAGCMFIPSEAANLRFRGGTVTPDPPTTETCPRGLAYTAFDGCLSAQPNAQFQDPDLIATYALSQTGQPQTIYHVGPYNKVGIDFPTGQTTTTGKEDPRDFSVVGTASITGATVKFVTITNGGTPKVGMWVWDRPANGTQYYTAGTAPKINGACTGALPALVCPLDRSVTNRGNHVAYASLWHGCVDLISGVDWSGAPGDQSVSYDVIYCDFRASVSTAKAQITNIEFGPIGGHNASILSAVSHDNTTSMGEVEISNSHITVDSFTASNNVLSAGLASANVRLTLKDSECDGGNANDPLIGPYTYPQWVGCFSWDSPGSATWGRNQVLVQNVYAHDYAANPFSTQAGNTDTVFQNVFAIRISMNCGDSGPPLNGCHGTFTAHGTTIRGASGSIAIRNVTIVYPYGQRNGVVTGAVSLQGGAGSAASMDAEFSGLTIISNNGYDPGKAIIGEIARVHRVGAVSNLKVQHLYSNSHGSTKCVAIFGDLQANTSYRGAMVANSSGDRSSTITWSGFPASGTMTLPYPGSWLVPGPGSGAKEFSATLADRGDGKSNLTIIGTPPSTIAAGLQIGALRLANPTTNPTLIVSGSGSNYIVDNGSGSGETRAEQVFSVAQILMPFGTVDPATGAPSTATGGSSGTSFNGTWVARGLQTYTAPNPGTGQQNWSTLAPGLGNITTIDTDTHDMWMMNIAGDAGKIVLDGLNLDRGSCPGTGGA